MYCIGPSASVLSVTLTRVSELSQNVSRYHSRWTCPASLLILVVSSVSFLTVNVTDNAPVESSINYKAYVLLSFKLHQSPECTGGFPFFQLSVSMFCSWNWLIRLFEHTPSMGRTGTICALRKIWMTSRGSQPCILPGFSTEKGPSAKCIRYSPCSTELGTDIRRQSLWSPS